MQFTIVLLMPFLAPTLGFVVPSPKQPPFCSTATNTRIAQKRIPATPSRPSLSSLSPSAPSSTALSAMIDVPYWYFTLTFAGYGLLLSVSKNFNRMRMEERAWEQRLEEGRRRRLEEDPTLTEIDLRRQEAALEWSAYGKPRQEEEAYRKQQQQQQQHEEERRGGGGRNRVRVMDREHDEDEDEEYDEDAVARQSRMTDEEIDRFEIEYGIDYDPYYDDPYTEDELPEGKRQVNKRYGDVVYEDGEIFYKDAQTGLYYRQGAKPRSVKFYN